MSQVCANAQTDLNLRLAHISDIVAYIGHIQSSTLRKHAYSNVLKILQPKKGQFLNKKNSPISRIAAQNIDCGHSLEPPRRGGSNEYPHSMFLA